MKNQNLFPTLVFTGAIVIGLLFVSNILYAWTAPTANPPGNDAATPLNQSTMNQIKPADITVWNSKAGNQMWSPEYCDYTGSNCFAPADIVSLQNSVASTSSNSNFHASTYYLYTCPNIASHCTGQFGVTTNSSQTCDSGSVCTTYTCGVHGDQTCTSCTAPSIQSCTTVGPIAVGSGGGSAIVTTYTGDQARNAVQSATGLQVADVVHASQIEGNAACAVLKAGSTLVYYTTQSFVSPSNNSFYRYNGTSWSYTGADSSAWIKTITCQG